MDRDVDRASFFLSPFRGVDSMIERSTGGRSSPRRLMNCNSFETRNRQNGNDPTKPGRGCPKRRRACRQRNWPRHSMTVVLFQDLVMSVLVRRFLPALLAFGAVALPGFSQPAAPIRSIRMPSYSVE